MLKKLCYDSSCIDFSNAWTLDEGILMLHDPGMSLNLFESEPFIGIVLEQLNIVSMCVFCTTRSFTNLGDQVFCLGTDIFRHLQIYLCNALVRGCVPTHVLEWWIPYYEFIAQHTE